MTYLSKLEAQYSGLSKSHQKIARYVRENPRDIMFLPLAQLAEKAGTSPATLVRFARALGYDGFPDMQKDVQNQAASAAADDAASTDDATGLAADSCESLARMYREIDYEQLGRVSRLLLDAEDVLVIGYMDAFGTAAELFHRLHCFREGLHFSRMVYDWNDMLRLMKPGTVVMAVSFEPHYRYTLNCVATAKERGSRVVLITDNPLNPFSAFTDEMLALALVRRPGGGRLNRLDLSPVSGFINYLAGFVEYHYPERLLDAERHQESFVE